jgi:(p)ppGpp synthase/HD superfamily hydrolase
LVAIVAHRNQRDKGGNTYARHPLRIAEYLQTEHEQSLAHLHDVCEDTDVTLDDLRTLGFSPTDIMVINALTKPKDRALYDEEKYLSEIEKSPCAARIKYLDMRDNARLDRLKNPTLLPKDVDRMNSYIRGMKRLRAFVVGLMVI